MSLAEFQRAMLRALFSDRPNQAISALDGMVAGADPSAGLDIYRRNVVFGVVGQLERTYPACRALVGPRNFRFLARQLMLDAPPTCRDIREIGRPYPDFLARRRELADLPFLPDLARLEWLVFCLRRSPVRRVETLSSRFPVAELHTRFTGDVSSQPLEVAMWERPREIVVVGDPGGVTINGATLSDSPI